MLTSRDSMWSRGQRHAICQRQLEPEHDGIKAAGSGEGHVDGLRLTV